MILITGATGLLGSHLLYELTSSGKKVRATFRNRKSIDKTRQIFSYYGPASEALLKGVEWVKGDVLDISQLEQVSKGVDEIYHCAGIVSFSKKQHKHVLKTNIEGTSNILNAAILNDVGKFCHVSSIASFGKPEKNKQTINESSHRDETEVSSVYSYSKYMAELEVWRAVEEGLNAVIINPSTIIGSGNWNAGSSALFSRVWKGLSYYTEGINGFVDVRDVVKVMKALMENNVFKEQYIVVSENLSFKDVISFIAKSLDLNAPTIRANKIISEFAWRLEELRCSLSKTDPVITKESAQIAQDTQFYSNKKIRDLLNLDFIPIRQSVLDASKNFLNLSKTS